MTRSADHATYLARIAAEFGTPTYVTDARRIDRRIAMLRENLGGLVDRLLYALKANALPEISELMRDRGLGVDVVSPGEIIMAERLGFSAEMIFYSANNMTDDEMAFAAQRSVVMNIGEVSRLASFAARYPGSNVSIRINTRHGAGHHRHVVTAGQESKFGIPISLLNEVRSIASQHNLKIAGLHQHIGSGNLDVEPYRKSLSVLFDVAASLPDLAFVNVGGGLGIPYHPDDAEIDLVQLAGVMERELSEFEARHARRPAVWMEPGRYLVADSGVLLVQVNTIKESHGHTYAGTDSGMNHLLRPAMYGAYHEIVNVSNPDGRRMAYQVVGNICESSDFFARDRTLEEIREGDVLAILDSGAYGASMASEYNLRPAPAEVFVDLRGTARLVRRRETPEEMVDRILAARTLADTQGQEVTETRS